MDVKARLEQLMEERGWTIYRLAKESHIPWSTVRNMFKRNNDPSLFTLESICKGLGMSLAQFFDENNQSGLTDEQRRLLQDWNRLDDRDKRLVSELLASLNEKK